jgi:hypothetical protein
MISDRLSNLWLVYGEAFRLHAHQLLAWAHEDAKALFQDHMDEPDLTGLLAEAMWKRLNEHPNTPDAYLHYSIGDQVPHSPAGQLGNDRLRLDLTVIRNGIRPRLVFVMEAKRLRTQGFPIGKYIGEGGMGDFISCRYAADSPEAAMIGLVGNRDTAYWHTELRRAADEDAQSSQSKLGLKSPLKEINFLTELAGELSSDHHRKDGSHLRLFHIFLDCRSSSEAR